MRFFSLFLVLFCMSNNIFAQEVISANLPIDLSPQTLYQNAHIVVKAVVIILLICSIITWTIFLFKGVQVFVAINQLRKDKKTIHSVQSVQDILSNPLNKVSYLFLLANQIDQEIHSSQHHFDQDFVSRTEYRLTNIIKQQTQKIRLGVSPLATIGSVAPFIGLFGTVWGIMNSFIGIAQTRSTDLYAVAPGIAEALFATALGLVAAIPAVIIYNIFIRYTHSYSEQLTYLASLLQLMLRREIALQKGN